jgi:hypothetical protein
MLVAHAGVLNGIGLTAAAAAICTALLCVRDAYSLWVWRGAEAAVRERPSLPVRSGDVVNGQNVAGAKRLTATITEVPTTKGGAG